MRFFVSPVRGSCLVRYKSFQTESVIVVKVITRTLHIIKDGEISQILKFESEPVNVHFFENFRKKEKLKKSSLLIHTEDGKIHQYKLSELFDTHEPPEKKRKVID